MWGMNSRGREGGERRDLDDGRDLSGTSDGHFAAFRTVEGRRNSKGQEVNSGGREGGEGRDLDDGRELSGNGHGSLRYLAWVSASARFSLPCAGLALQVMLAIICCHKSTLRRTPTMNSGGVRVSDLDDRSDLSGTGHGSFGDGWHFARPEPHLIILGSYAVQKTWSRNTPKTSHIETCVAHGVVHGGRVGMSLRLSLLPHNLLVLLNVAKNSFRETFILEVAMGSNRVETFCQRFWELSTYGGTSLIRNRTPPSDHHICYCRFLGGGGFL